MNITQTTTKYQTYPKYKPSGIDWLGKIPEAWNVKRIKHTTYVKGRIGWQNLRSDEFSDEGVLCITGTDFKNGYIDIKNAYRVNKDRYDQDPYIQLKENDLLITKDGTIGKIALVKGLNELATLNSGIFVTRPLQNAYIQKFLFWLLNSRVFAEFIHYEAHGSTIEHLYQNIFVNFAYPLPPINQQQSIVDFLDRETKKIDEVIAKKQKLTELLLEKRQAIISQAVTKGLNPKAKMKDSGIPWLGEIPQSWETKPLKRVVQNKVVKGVGKELVFLALEHVISGKGVLIPEYEQEIVKADEYAVFDKGQILFGKLRPYLRKFYRPNFEGCCPTEFLVLSPQKSVNDDYVFYLVQSNYFISLTDATSYGVKMPRTSWEALSPNYIPLPPENEQVAIADYLNSITLHANLLVNKIEAQNQKLQEFRQALISNAVTGKVKV